VSCAGTGDDERLAAYWLGDLDQAEAAELAVEEHLFDCDACFAVASRLGQIVWALRARVPSTLTSRAIERLGARGVRMKHTRIRAGERVTAVFDRDLDLLVHHLEHDLSEVERVDVEVRTTDGVALMAVPDLHFEPQGGEVNVVCFRHYVEAFPPDGVLRLVSVGPEGRRVLGDYGVMHIVAPRA
jgi:hypothetical protein